MIVAAARRVIAERGLSATTVRDIAAAAGVAVGTVTYHFSGLAEVLAGVLISENEMYSAPIRRRAEGAPTGRAGLEALITGLLASDARAHDHWLLWLDFWALAAHRPEYARWQAEVYADLHGLVAGLLDRGRDDGSLTITDAAREAVEVIALMDGLVVQAYLPGTRLTPARARQSLCAYVDRTMTG